MSTAVQGLPASPEATHWLFCVVWDFYTRITHEMQDAGFAAGPQPPVSKKRRQSMAAKSAGK